LELGIFKTVEAKTAGNAAQSFLTKNELKRTATNPDVMILIVTKLRKKR
jgi:hypothetical protein